MTYDMVLRSRRVVLPSGESPAAVCVSGGRIAAVLGYSAQVSALNDRSLGSYSLLPGLVDTHVHVNEPGRTEWEGFASATRAAAAGGVATLVDMPLNSVPPTINASALAVKQKAASGQCFVDVGFWGGAVPSNRDELTGLDYAGVFGFKCFLADSGVEEFPPLEVGGMEATMRVLAGFDGLLIVHAEDASGLVPARSGRRYRDFLASRPAASENSAIKSVIDAARRTGVRAHILHLASASALPLIAAAKADGIRITAETCPHYLTFDADSVPDGATQFKCCPPIREAEDREALWEAVASGVVDLVVSDHSPSTPDLKRFDSGDFAAAWGGISSLQLGLSAVWTGARRRGYSLADVVSWMGTRTADFAGLSGKGRIAEGCDADFVVFDPEASFSVDPSTLEHKNPVTAYAGLTLSGRVVTTYLRGTPVADEPNGRFVTKGMAR